ncbi:unnamed protein product [Mesocestoides corti]|uniref:GPI ethanolamine phosphate transferase 1 n=1 Tax=Mesocestoides corti TaxID=53468 RepID=A0A0R3U3F9_MESCO|nr:unnamed protein product [Mesocestoides corti]
MFSSKLGIIFSVSLYILLFYSIFDIYYTSPLTHGLSYDRPSVPGLVNNVVFIVADGLRYDKLFTEKMEHTPTLRSIVMDRGSWGFSHTRVPTESRPGHVALFAGFYEDVASVTKGWQANAVEFDSVFNRSNQVFAWGGPDVVPMFQPPDRVGDARVRIESYPHSMLDFTAENITQVDDWVVDRFSEFMTAESDLLLKTDSSGSAADGFRRGNLVFLHLSAADQMGHTQKPGSEEYTRMIQNIDANIARVLKLFEGNKQLAQETAFIFTADHGMTEWGSHGAGSLHETVTPLIVWGKHIPTPSSVADLSRASGADGLLPFNYGLKHYNVRQADLCPLIAALLGTPIPANSVGELPLDLLDVDSSLKVALIRENAQHILKQLHVTRRAIPLIRASCSVRLFDKVFSKLTQNQITAMLATATSQTRNQDYSAAIETYRSIIRLSLEGLNYYHKYDRFFMGFCIVASYAVWSLMLYADMVSRHGARPSQQNGLTKSTWTSSPSTLLVFLALCFTGVLIIRSVYHRSLLRTFYQLLPLILSTILLTNSRFRLVLSRSSGHFFSAESTNEKRTGPRLGMLLLLLTVLMEFALWGFIRRPLLSFGALLLGAWPYIDVSFIVLSNRQTLQRLWLAACLVLAVFPTLPVVGSFSSPTLVLISSVCVSAASYVFLQKRCESKPPHFWSTEPHFILVVGALVSGVLVFLVRCLVALSAPIPLLIHVISWILLVATSNHTICVFFLVASPAVAMVSADLTVSRKLVSLTLAFFIPFNLMNVLYPLASIRLAIRRPYSSTTLSSLVRGSKILSRLSELFFFGCRRLKQCRIECPPGTRYEGAFFFVLTTVAFMWSWFESGLEFHEFFGLRLASDASALPPVTGEHTCIDRANLRQPFFYVSFRAAPDPSATENDLLLILSFSQLQMVCPIMVIGTVYALIGRVRESLRAGLSTPRRDTHHTETTILMIIANFLAVHFFAMLRDEGSWLDIGESISHYVIAMSIGLASVLLSLFGRRMLTPPTPTEPRLLTPKLK